MGVHTPEIGGKPEQERLISYLPLSHIAGFTLDVAIPAWFTATTPGSPGMRPHTQSAFDSELYSPSDARSPYQYCICRYTIENNQTWKVMLSSY